MSNKIEVSVPGKIILMGEHAVVYGWPALLAAINLRLAVTVEAADKLEIKSQEPIDYVQYAVKFLAKEYQLPEPPKVKITIKSEIPAGYHLGSSAAVAVGTVGALTYYLKKVWNPQAINQLAYEIEKKQHGTPSGADNTICTFGGLIYFRRELEFLNSIWQLPFKLPQALNHFYLSDTGKPKETTKEMVDFVRSLKNKEQIFAKNEEQVKRLTVAIKEGNEQKLIGALQIGEATLEDLGVVSQQVIPFVRVVEKSGGAAKILGGGGKKAGVGYLLCYHPDWSVLSRLGKQYHYPLQAIRLAEEGIRLKK